MFVRVRERECIHVLKFVAHGNVTIVSVGDITQCNTDNVTISKHLGRYQFPYTKVKSVFDTGVFTSS